MGALLMPRGRQQLADVEKWSRATTARPADCDIRTRRKLGCPVVDLVTTKVGCSWAVAMAACLKQSLVEAFVGESGGTDATSTRGSTVQVCPMAPYRRYKPVRPAWKAGPGIDPTVMAVKSSLHQTTAPPRPRPVTATAGSGNAATPAVAHQSWVQRCPVNSPRRQTPTVPAKQASRATESTVTTVRDSPGLVSLGPGPVATAAGNGGGVAAAGEQWS